MRTKNTPGKFDCYDAAEPDEPMFVLLARDPLAPLLVEIWADVRSILVKDGEKVMEARDCAAKMREWPITKRLKHKIAIDDEAIYWDIINAIVQFYQNREVSNQ